MNYKDSWQGLSRAELQYAAAQAQELQRAIHVMTAALAAGEWAEHVSTDPDVMALECEITKLIGKVQAKLAAAPPSGLHESAQDGSTAKQWRCFHCDEFFTEENAARAHFGPRIYSDPACTVDAAKLRDLEARMQRYYDEDTEWHRAFYKLGSDHHQAMGRHGDAEYARGLRDGVSLPADSPERASLTHESAQAVEPTAAVRDVLAERRRQVEVEGYVADHDDDHGCGELAGAAACYAVGVRDEHTLTFSNGEVVWPWPGEFKPKDYRSNLIRSGALILAEIERLDRRASPPPGSVDTAAAPAQPQGAK